MRCRCRPQSRACFPKKGGSRPGAAAAARPRQSDWGQGRPVSFLPGPKGLKMVLAASGDQRPGRGGVCRRVPLGTLAFAGLLSLTALSAGGDSSAPAGPKGQRMAFLDNNLFKIGVDLTRGGSIGFLADVHKGGSV